jgi:hypothetical protein
MRFMVVPPVGHTLLASGAENKRRELMRFHVEALFMHDAAGDLVRVNEPSGARAPRFFLGRTADGAVLRFRDDVDHDTRRELVAAAEHDAGTPSFDAPIQPAEYEAILARRAPVQRSSAGLAFCFPDQLSPTDGPILITDENAYLLRPLLHEWLPDVQLGQPMFARVVDGHAVALCCTVRQTNAAHEAGVETAAAYRGQGHVGQTVIAWAQAVRDMNRVPLYSTSWDNQASRAVARKLGLVQFGSDAHIT